MNTSITLISRLPDTLKSGPTGQTIQSKLLKLGCLLALGCTPFHAFANSSPTLERAPAKSAAVIVAPMPPAVLPQDPVAEIYQHAKRPLLWSAFGHPTETAFDAIDALAKATEHGLDPERYATTALYELVTELNTGADLAAFDQLLTTAIWTYNEDLRRGEAPTAGRNAKLPRVADDVIVALADAINNDALNAHLESHVPQFPSYQRLQQALETYRGYQLMDGWASLPNDTRLKPGDQHPSIPLLRQRLALTDGLDENSLTSEHFDAPLEAAIKRFQERHQLQADGEVGPATLAKLNVSVSSKLRWLSLNLARLRELPTQLPDDRIQVNIPEFQLRMYRDTAQTLTMGVVVGSKRNPTPSMQDRMRHLVFNPYWYPTRKITVNEILPRLKRDPDYLKRSQFEMIERRSKKVVDAAAINWQDVKARKFPYRFRQIPGEKNSLGQVKFIFPNTQAIYLHDTPSKNLFSERVRAFSHGCVRVEKPTELATHLMAWDRGWTETDVLADIGAAKRKLRKFKREMDIYLLYQTVAVRNERVTFFPDIYRRDRAPRISQLQAPAVAAALQGTKSRTAKIRSIAAR